jgi:hypothetical protein
MCSGIPSTEKPACSMTDAESASESRISRKACRSSIPSLEFHGRESTTEGPPVSNENGPGACTGLPSSARTPARSVNSHRSPAGRSRVKSYAHVKLSSHRAVPSSGQSIANGDSGGRGLPSGTIGRENFAVTWRTFFVVPSGENCVMTAAGPDAGNAGA